MLKKYKGLTLALIITILFTAGNYFWLKKQNAEYITDSVYSYYFQHTISFSNFIAEKDIKGVFRFIKEADMGPVYPFLSALFCNIFGKSYSLMILSLNFFGLFFLLFSTYLLTEYIWGKYTGFIAVLLISIYPAVYGLSRQFCPDFFLIGSAAFFMWALFRSKGFIKKNWVIVFTATVIAAVYIKYYVVLFAAGPVILTGYFFIKNNYSKKRVINMAVLVLIIGLSFVPFYLPSSKPNDFISRLSVESIGPWYIFENLRVYTAGIFEEQLSPFLFILFIISLITLLKHEKSDELYVLLSWIILPWIVLIFIPHKKYTFYIVTYLPAFAAISAKGLSLLSKSKSRSILAALITLSIIQYFDYSFGLGPALYRLKIKLGENRYIRYVNANERIIYSKDKRKKTYEMFFRQFSNKKVESMLFIENPELDYQFSYCVVDNAIWFKNLNIRLDKKTIKDLSFIDVIDYDMIVYAGEEYLLERIPVILEKYNKLPSFMTDELVLINQYLDKNL